MRQLVGELAHQAPALDVEALSFDRIPDSPRAWAVQLVRHVRAGGELAEAGRWPIRSRAA